MPASLPSGHGEARGESPPRPTRPCSPRGSRWGGLAREGTRELGGPPSGLAAHPTAEVQTLTGRGCRAGSPPQPFSSRGLTTGLLEHSERRPLQKNGCVLCDPRTVPKRCLSLDSIYQPPTEQIPLGFPRREAGRPTPPATGPSSCPGEPPAGKGPAKAQTPASTPQ